MDLDIQLSGPDETVIQERARLEQLLKFANGVHRREKPWQGIVNDQDLAVEATSLLLAALSAPAVIELVKCLRAWVEGMNEARRKRLRVKIGDDEFDASGLNEETLLKLQKNLIAKTR